MTRSRVLVDGTARGEALVLEEPLSFWGGLAPATGEIIDRNHPQVGDRVADRVLVLERTRGSTSAPGVLLEAIRVGGSPAAILLAQPDVTFLVAILVAKELYRRTIPLLVLDADDFRAIRTGDRIRIEEGGRLSV